MNEFDAFTRAEKVLICIAAILSLAMVLSVLS
jgi:cell division protein FtsL